MRQGIAEDSKNKSTEAEDDGDWLGYGAYADALWARVIRALNQDQEGKTPLGDDPLVVGIFGEWGAGKSHLLKLIYNQAQDQSRRDIAERVLSVTSGLPLTITVPVMFQPWKYEHEPHLHVPLAIHVADALDEAWKKLPADFETVKVWASDATKTLSELGDKVESVQKVARKLGKFWQGLQKAVKSDAAEVVAGTLDVLAASVGAPPVLSAGLSKAKDALGDSEDDSDTAKNKEETSGDKPKQSVKADDKPSPFAHSSDGLAFYRINKLVRAMTRPKLDKKLLKAAGIKVADGIEFDLRINFVVFVDDLDRCLPEKAVQTLELIKTTFNTESFAFVLALDDEVIERGIGHRYKEYKLLDKKPEMPITGFEYLEKIVHVPFRLPALSEAEAAEFVARYERKVQPNEAQLWFQEREEIAKPFRLGYSKLGGADLLSGGQSVNPSLLDIALSGFDSYMPRKLTRLVELMHQVAQIARERKSPLSLSPSSGVDVRVVLALLMIQLFQPELHRILRRRDESFPTLLMAFSSRGNPSDTGAPDFPNPHLSDIDLWRWAIEPRPAKPVEWAPPSVDQSYSHAVAAIDKYHIGEENLAARNTAQQVRLPLVVQLIEHRSAHRHVFDVLKIAHKLAEAMEATQSNPHALNFGPYKTLLSKGGDRASTDGVRIPASPITNPWLQSDERVRFALRDVNELVQDLFSTDTASQANIASRHELQSGKALDARTLKTLEGALKIRLAAATLDDSLRLQLLSGLRFLAPYIGRSDGQSLWALVEKTVDILKDTEPKLRAQWGDVRSAFGRDQRFDPERPYKMRQRFQGHSEDDEPIPGFVRIASGRFMMGSDHGQDKVDNPEREATLLNAFYLQRTPVTVEQYAGFVRAGGYGQDQWWDHQGIAWRDGLFNSKAENKEFNEHLSRRSGDLRHQPMEWADQLAAGVRPVWGINWFEARAYCRWLDGQLAAELGIIPALRGLQVQLPTELQWERASRAASLANSDTRIWTWGNDESLAQQKANLSQAIGGVCTVGLYDPNPIGLYDMAGNVWEWMDNLYRPEPDSFERIARDLTQKSGKSHDHSDCPALRGGSWTHDPDGARCSCRSGPRPDYWSNYIGFRLALSTPISEFGF